MSNSPFLEEISKEIDDITLLISGNKNWESLHGVFSFVLYYSDPEKPLTDTDYYHGIMSYLFAAMNMKKYGINVGVFIVTDDKSYNIIRDSFSYEAVKDILTMCRVHWPRYEIEGELDKSIFRCMRYITLGFEELKGKWVAIRDADTLFPYEMYNIAWMMERIKEYTEAKGEVKDKLAFIRGDEYDFYTNKGEWGLPTTDKFHLGMILGHLIAKWETEFIHTYKSRPHSIVFGVGNRYVPKWVINYNPSKNEETFHADFGLYAGFVTFFESRPDDIWNTIYLFITMRYTIESLITDKDKGYYIGKDEQLLLFAVLPKYSLKSTFFLVSYNSEEFFKYSIECMMEGGGKRDYNSIADKNGLIYSEQVLRAILRTKGISEERMETIDTKNPRYAMGWLYDELTPDLRQILLGEILNIAVKGGKLYNATNSRNKCDTRPLSSIMLQIDYVKAVSGITSIKLYGYDRRYPIESIIRGHVRRYEKWCKDHFPEWATIVFPPTTGGRARNIRTHKTKKRVNKTRSRRRKYT
jgi:hypothetical protein